MAEQAKLLMERQDTQIKELTEKFQLELSAKDDKIAKLENDIRTNANQQDALGQYVRRDNLKIEGVKWTDGEDTNTIVKEIAAEVGVEIKDEDISTSHRIGTNKEQEENTSETVGVPTAPKKPPSIIVRFNRRDIKVKFFEARKTLQTSTSCPAHYKSAEIYEDVTPLRSRIMYELRTRNQRQMFKYVWSRGGRIYCLKPEDVVPRDHQGLRKKPTVINTPEDLAKVGFSQKEIEDIIMLKRN